PSPVIAWPGRMAARPARDVLRAACRARAGAGSRRGHARARIFQASLVEYVRWYAASARGGGDGSQFSPPALALVGSRRIGSRERLGSAPSAGGEPRSESVHPVRGRGAL